MRNNDSYIKKLKNMNSEELLIESSKIFADRYAECRYKISIETDPLKKAKMETRLALGNTDFSDLI